MDLKNKSEDAVRKYMNGVLNENPLALKNRIIQDLGVRPSRRPSGKLTSKEANEILWQSYRLKIGQVTTLFQVKHMGDVVNVCVSAHEKKTGSEFKQTPPIVNETAKAQRTDQRVNTDSLGKERLGHYQIQEPNQLERSTELLPAYGTLNQCNAKQAIKAHFREFRKDGMIYNIKFEAKNGFGYLTFPDNPPQHTDRMGKGSKEGKGKNTRRRRKGVKGDIKRERGLWGAEEEIGLRGLGREEGSRKVKKQSPLIGNQGLGGQRKTCTMPVCYINVNN